MSKYNQPVPSYGDLFSIQEWLSLVEEESFIQYDGMGHYVKDGMMDSCSDCFNFPPPSDATHVAWFNK